MIFYAIREKNSEKYLPQPKRGRGNSFTEPTEVNIEAPRLFISEISAKNALTAWLRGCFYHYSHTYQTFEGSEFEEYTDVKKQDYRKRENMEIVIFKIVINKIEEKK